MPSINTLRLDPSPLMEDIDIYCDYPRFPTEADSAIALRLKAYYRDIGVNIPVYGQVLIYGSYAYKIIASRPMFQVAY